MCQGSRTCLVPSARINPGSCWAGGSAGPILPQLLCKLIAGCRPVVADTIAKLHDMALKVELVLL